MFGTMTAGETAAMTEPRIAASSSEMSSSFGASNIIPAISKQAGTKHIKIAGRPTFFKSSRFNDNPARIKIMIRAILRRSADTDKMEASIRSSA